MAFSIRSFEGIRGRFGVPGANGYSQSTCQLRISKKLSKYQLLRAGEFSSAKGGLQERKSASCGVHDILEDL
jgi:hypothetical protein